MSSDDPFRQQLRKQLYGDPIAKPLKIDIVSAVTADNSEVTIYLLIQNQKGSVSAVGFADTQRRFTFAFSTLELAEEFVAFARTINFMNRVDRVLPMTVSEYFATKKVSWSNADICLDPNADMLTHPNVKLGIQNSN